MALALALRLLAHASAPCIIRLVLCHFPYWVSLCILWRLGSYTLHVVHCETLVHGLGRATRTVAVHIGVLDQCVVSFFVQQRLMRYHWAGVQASLTFID
jgi:hypothetical protein